FPIQVRLCNAYRSGFGPARGYFVETGQSSRGSGHRLEGQEPQNVSRWIFLHFSSSWSLIMSKISLVTGGSRGLGRNAVLSIARKGGDVIFTYQNREADALQ